MKSPLDITPEQLLEMNKSHGKTDQERIDAVLSSPFFMNSLSEDDNQVLEALKALQFDGDPLEVAENFKNQGNSCFKAKKYQDAIIFYSKGIAVDCDNNELNSVLYSNRAAVNLALENYRRVLNDCAKAIKLNSKNIKAYFRSIKALHKLDKIEEAIDCCSIAMKLDPENQDFSTEMSKLLNRKKILEELEIKKENERKEKEKYELERQKSLDNLEAKLISGGEVYQHPNAPTSEIKLLQDKTLTFPVLFLYPQYKQSDFIAEFHQNETFYAQLQEMFSTVAPWDEKNEYHPQMLEILFETNEEKPKLISLVRSIHASKSPSQSAAHRYCYLTLGDVIKSPHFRIRNGVCTFIILVRDTEFQKEFKSKYT